MKKELLRLNVDYALFKGQEVHLFFYPNPGHHSHTFRVEPNPSSLISRSSEVLTENEEESDQDVELVRETDVERREALLASDQNPDSSNKLGPSTSWKTLEQEFDFSNQSQATLSNVPIDEIIDLSSDDDDDNPCSIPVASGSTFTHGHNSTAKGTGKSISSDIKENTSSKARHSKPNAIARMVEAEINLRKESLGMAPVKGSGRTVGSTPMKWDCLVCTLSVTFRYRISPWRYADTCSSSENQPSHLSCSACSTPRGELTWSQI